MAVLEAWSYRLPVLMTAECNLPDGFRHDAALKIDTSAPGIAAGMQRLMNQPPERLRQIGENGYELVRQSYTWDRVARDTLQLYRWALGMEETIGATLAC
jgi:poly(glycerol-phosphate) alpha-glucosyltransferase